MNDYTGCEDERFTTVLKLFVTIFSCEVGRHSSLLDFLPLDPIDPQ